MACTAAVRYLPPSDCLGIIIQAVNLNAMLALIWTLLIPVLSRHLHLLSLAEKRKRKREPLLIAHSNKNSAHTHWGVVAEAYKEVWFGDGSWVARGGLLPDLSRGFLSSFFFFWMGQMFQFLSCCWYTHVLVHARSAFQRMV